jgi:hypothetical protein
MNSVLITCVSRINNMICLVLLSDMSSHKMTAQKLKLSPLYCVRIGGNACCPITFFLKNDCYWTVFPKTNARC